LIKELLRCCYLLTPISLDYNVLDNDHGLKMQMVQLSYSFMFNRRFSILVHPRVFRQNLTRNEGCMCRTKAKSRYAGRGSLVN